MVPFLPIRDTKRARSSYYGPRTLGLSDNECIARDGGFRRGDGMKSVGKTATQTALLDQRMGKLGAELFVKATLCAATMALIAGMLAAIIGG
jgi:hypothetical protein